MDDPELRSARSVKNLQPVDHYLHGSWEALGAGAPVLVALAQLCSQAMVEDPSANLHSAESLTPEAKTILVSARARGVIEIKAVNTAFRDPNDPEVTVSFLEGFRQLCRSGLVVHHIHRDFSLTALGFKVARRIDRDEVQIWLDKGTEFGLHD
jgi:hypothetical protein